MSEQGFETALTAMTAKWADRFVRQVEDDPQGHCQALLSAAVASGGVIPGPIDENTSDGYHTFGELYEHRMLLTALLLNAWHRLEGEGIGDAHSIYKTRNHHPEDGEPMFAGMFKVGATLPTGEITYHYPIESWGHFHIHERDWSPLWDGHTSADVAHRLGAYLTGD